MSPSISSAFGVGKVALAVLNINSVDSPTTAAIKKPWISADFLGGGGGVGATCWQHWQQVAQAKGGQGLGAEFDEAMRLVDSLENNLKIHQKYLNRSNLISIF